MFSAVKKDREEFLRYSNNLTQLIGKDYIRIPRMELKALLSEYYVNQQKIADVVNRLRTVIIKDGVRVECLEIRP